MSPPFKAACIQLSSTDNIAENLKQAELMIREAAGKGAKLIVTPENTCHILTPSIEKLKTAVVQEAHPAIEQFSKLAFELGVWILIGSIAIKIADDKLANRSMLFSPEGSLYAHYDKIHLFDVKLPTGEVHRESDLIAPGEKLVLADTPLAKIGLSICYDVRFPQLYRALAQKGAQILAIPSAFTVPTGLAHWEVLLRARAIENGCYVIAAGQTGQHHGGRKTYGHSMIVSPWGEVLADGGDNVGIIYADIDLAQVDVARNAIPALTHDRAMQ
jgi:predicted amidohydrolase